MLESLFEIGKNFVADWGLFGLFLFSATEAFIQPIPVEVVLSAEAATGLNPTTAFIVALAGNLTGGAIGFFLGKTLGHPVAVKLFGAKKMDKVEKFFLKWEFWGVFLIAFTPLPYKAASWGAGIFELKFWQFMLASFLGRGLRFAIVAYGLSFIF